MTIGRLTLALAGLSLLSVIWEVSVLSNVFRINPLNVIPIIATPLLCVAGLIVGAMDWITRRKTDGDQCLIGAISCLAIFVVSVYVFGRAVSGYR